MLFDLFLRRGNDILGADAEVLKKSYHGDAGACPPPLRFQQLIVRVMSIACRSTKSAGDVRIGFDLACRM
jgi:hypothetical protein